MTRTGMKGMGRRGVGLLLLSGVALCALHGIATAQQAPTVDGPLQEILVTAQKRSENLQDVPVAITALTAETLEKMDVRDVQDLPSLTPGLQIKTSDASANPKIFIRGVGLNDFNANAAGAVGIYMDGVFVASPLAQLGQFFDLERVEVLKGPQGTLYGRNTTGGAINITARQPTFETTSDGSLEYGRYNAVKAEAGAGGAIVPDKLAMRIAGVYERDDGDTFNRVTNSTVNAVNRWGGRASLLFTPNEDLSVTVQLHGGQNRGDSRYTQARALIPQDPSVAGANGLCAAGQYASGLCTDALGYADTDNNPYAGDYNLKGKDKVDTWGASVNVRWDLGKATLYSITGFDSAERDDVEDTDASPNSLIQSAYKATQHDISQELRVEAPLTDKLRGVAGAYFLHDYLNTSSQYDILRDLRPLFVTDDNPTGFSLENNVATVGYPYTQTGNSYAVFGQVDYQLTDRVTLTGGLRYSQDDKDFRYRSTVEDVVEVFSYANSKSFDSVSGRASIQVRPADDVMVYASYNRGYKSGGFFGGYTRDPADLKPYADETLDAYEVGAKTELWDKHLRLNAASFYYDYSNLQVFQIVTRDGIPTQTFNNAANARLYGVDADITLAPMKGLEISLGGEYLNSEYLNYVSEGESLSGNRLPSAPRWTLTGLVSYDQPLDGIGGKDMGTLNASLNVSYRSLVYFDSHNLARLSQGGYWLTDARLGWTAPNGTISLGLWVRNLFDRTYIMDINNLDSFGLDALSMGSPRRFGGYLNWHF
ncbi:TonB-dependent receptor [Nitrospirillum iridis]|uniref:Iron complex outermembrane receptor protein n=1 Tax=Nitrospirillum iridis TaxID=765888 RepID=A0A7X0B304_9PROT|nr:TonB-dependent receptor [Nitrospirillum iridis]MBB6254447.1 iron complex outermembrane receptor protein [Nitrospirillum iridis]